MYLQFMKRLVAKLSACLSNIDVDEKNEDRLAMIKFLQNNLVELDYVTITDDFHDNGWEKYDIYN